MLKKSILTIFTVAAAGLASNVKADQTFDWSFTTTANVVDGSGTLTVDISGTIVVDGNTGYTVTSLSGIYLGQAVTGLLPVGTDYADNLIANLTGTAEQLDGDGISFAFGTANTSENLWVPDSSDAEYVGPYGSGSDRETYGLNNGTFVAVPAVVVPESTNALALFSTAGLSLLFAGLRRK